MRSYSGLGYDGENGRKNRSRIHLDVIEMGLTVREVLERIFLQYSVPG